MIHGQRARHVPPKELSRGVGARRVEEEDQSDQVGREEEDGVLADQSVGGGCGARELGGGGKVEREGGGELEEEVEEEGEVREREEGGWVGHGEVG